MKKIKLILVILLSLNVIIGGAQIGSVNKSFSDFGIEDSLALKDMDVARLILEEPYLFDKEKELFFQQMKIMKPDEVQAFPALILRFRLTPFLGVSWDDSGKYPFNYITKIFNNSTSSKAGLRIGDRIKSLNDCKIKEAKDIRTCFDQIESGDEIRIGIERNKQDQIVVAKFQNRMGSYQPWKDDYFLDMMLGNISLDDFNGPLSSDGEEDELLSFRTPDGETYRDLMIPRETILLDTVLSRELIEDKLLSLHQKKLLFKELRDLPETSPYLFKEAKGKEDIPKARRFFIKGQMLKLKFEPKLGLNLKFDPTKNLSKVIAIEKGSCAEEAGVQIGDYLHSFDGLSITSNLQLFGVLPTYKSGSSVKLIVERNRKKKVFKTKLKNHFGDYRNWTPELMDAITDNNFELENYHYLKHKKYIRDTSLWGVPVKQITIASTVDMEMGYLPVISYSIDVIFHSDDDKTKFHQIARENNLSVVFLTKRAKLSYGGPTDPLYIVMPNVSFQEGKTTANFQHEFKMDELFRNVSDKELVSNIETSFYFKAGFEFFEVYILENNQAVDQQKMKNAYYTRDRNKYLPKKEEINSRTKKNKG